MTYYIINDVFNVTFMEDICVELGYTVERCHLDFTIYSKLFDEKGKEIGVINNQGTPSIEIYKRLKKHAIKISKNVNVIPPIKGIHRILDWHTVEGKLHKLAGGEIVLNFYEYRVLYLKTHLNADNQIINLVERLICNLLYFR